MNPAGIAALAAFLLLELTSFLTLAAALAVNKGATDRRARILADIEGAERLAGRRAAPTVIAYAAVVVALAAASAFLFFVRPHLL